MDLGNDHKRQKRGIKKKETEREESQYKDTLVRVAGIQSAGTL